jgi:hypothetical protein
MREIAEYALGIYELLEHVYTLETKDLESMRNFMKYCGLATKCWGIMWEWCIS